MPRSIQTAFENNFKGGYITEATGLNFPTDACTEQDNCIFDEKGRVRRRLGFDYERNAQLEALDVTDCAIRGFSWNNVGNLGTVAFRVMQIGDFLHFWRLGDDASVSTQKMEDVIDLTDFVTDVSVEISTYSCNFTATNKYLVVTHPQLEPFFVAYDAGDDSFTATEITVQIRDFVGMVDGLAVDERPAGDIAGLSDEHLYNLYNQGWYFNSAAALTDWETDRTDMPSNADVWWAYKNTSDEFDTTTIPNRDAGNTPAPKGHFILDVHNQDRETVSGISGIDPVSTGLQRVSTCAFFAGRVFYAGLNATGYGNQIYFSQIIEREEQFGYCYQSNDPTSELAFDLLPSDGGVITVFEVETIIKMIPTATSLLVFCTNGCWAISGNTGLGFTATDYSITKVGTTPCISENSFITVENMPIWWNTEGIFALLTSKEGLLEIQSLTDRTIRTDFLSIPVRSKFYAVGAYDSSTKTARWLFRRAASEDVNDDYAFDSVLTLNFLTGAFFTWSLSAGAIIHDLFSMITVGGSQSLELVTDDDLETVTDDLLEDVYVSVLTSDVVAPVFKYFISVDTDVTFAETNNTEYFDWSSVAEPVDYTSYFVTGYRLDGEGMNYFQSNYIFVYLESESNASCFMQGVWDWATNSVSGRYSTLQQVYSSRNNQAVSLRKLKVRGKGRALQLRFVSEAGKPFTIIGWGIWETANQSV